MLDNKLPRQDATGEFPIPGDVWNNLCDMVEAAKIDVAPPLELVASPAGGRMLRLIVTGVVVPLKLTDTEDGSGFYTGRAFQGKAREIQDGEDDLSLPSGLTDPGWDNALIFDPSATDGGSSSLDTPSWAGGLQVGMTNETPPRGVYMLMGGGGESVGEEMGQVRIMTAQNVASWDFPRCHAMES